MLQRNEPVSSPQTLTFNTSVLTYNIAVLILLSDSDRISLVVWLQPW